MIDVLRTAKQLQTVCEKAGWPFCFIGGLAIQRWGELRLTEDADATIFTGFGKELPVIESLLQRFSPRRPDAAAFAQLHRVLVLKDDQSGIGVDVSLGAFPFEQRAIERSSLYAYQRTIKLRTCSAEDLIVFKAFAARDLDWHDIKGILIRQRGALDLDLVERELVPLVVLKEEPEILDQWHALRDRYL